MRLPRKKNKRQLDAALPLINIVFLLLLFFLVAGQITPQQNQDIVPPISMLLDQGQPPGKGLSITREGEMFYRKRPVEVDEIGQLLAKENAEAKKECLGKCAVQIVVDHRLKAVKLLKILKNLRQQGLPNIAITTLKGEG